MLKHITLLFVFLSTSLFAQISFSPYHTKILKVTKNAIIVPNTSTIAIGSTGVIIQSFEQGHQTIATSVEVIKKDANTMLLKTIPLLSNKQEALPSYHITPKVGDEVVLNFLYERALAIVPDKETYKLVTQSYTAFSWVHPDIFASILAQAYNPTPTKETFQEVCTQQNIGLLLVATAGKGHFVDCRSFKTIDTISLPKAQSVKAPFYSRLDAIKGRLFGLFGGKGVKDYDNFYTKLLK